MDRGAPDNPNTARKRQSRQELGQTPRRATSESRRRTYSRRDEGDQFDVFASQPPRPVAMLDLEADPARPVRKPRLRPTTRNGNTQRPKMPHLTFRFANTGRVGSRVMRNVGYNVWAGLNLTRMACVVCLLGLLVLTYWLLNSPNFLISQVKLSGNHFLDVPGVLAQTNVDKTNIFLLDENQITLRLKQLPYVLDAKVQKAFPNQLDVQVVERQETVNWKIDQTNYLVDKDGMVLQVAQIVPNEAASFPVISSQDKRELKVGDKVDAVAVQSVGAIQTALSRNGIAVAALTYSPTNGLTVVSKDRKWQALFGTDAELNQKVNILKGLLADGTLKWSFADLRWTARPAVH